MTILPPVFLAAYLLGSIPFGLVLVRLAGKGDLRQIGSGNIGATNVLRTGSKTLALATLLLDSGKGAAAVLLAAPYGEPAAIVAALGAFLGHLFPIWLKFQGGKGVATTLGIYLAIAWPVGVGACLTWLVAAILFRISSLAALAAMVAAPALALYFADRDIAAMAVAIGLVVWVRHAANIRRLLNGTEPKIGRRKEADAPPAV
jgi:glycerol-3-phosphate acyltransferase PlsY